MNCHNANKGCIGFGCQSYVSKIQDYTYHFGVEILIDLHVHQKLLDKLHFLPKIIFCFMSGVQLVCKNIVQNLA